MNKLISLSLLVSFLFLTPQLSAQTDQKQISVSVSTNRKTPANEREFLFSVAKTFNLGLRLEDFIRKTPGDTVFQTRVTFLNDTTLMEKDSLWESTIADSINFIMFGQAGNSTGPKIFQVIIICNDGTPVELVWGNGRGFVSIGEKHLMLSFEEKTQNVWVYKDMKGELLPRDQLIINTALRRLNLLLGN